MIYSDPTGYFPFLIALILGGFAIAGGIIGGKVSHDNAVNAGKTGAELVWSTIGGTVLGVGFGLATGGSVIFTTGMLAGIFGAAGLATSVLGVTAHQAFAWGALAWNFSAWIIMPLYGISMQGIEYEMPSIGVFPPAI